MEFITWVIAALTLLALAVWAFAEIVFACRICYAARSPREFWKWAWGDAARYLGGVPFAIVFGVPTYVVLALVLPLLPRRGSAHRALSESLVPLDAVERLLKNNENLIHERDINGRTPLHIAALHRNDATIA